MSANEQANMVRYMRELNNFDWQFEYAEEYRVVKNGYIELAKLHELQKEVDPSGTVWRQYMPADSSHTPSVVMEKANG